MGLHCISASVDVGNAVLTVSAAVLSAMTTLAVISKQSKGHQQAVTSTITHTKSGSKKLTVAAFDKIVASLPDQVRFVNIPVNLVSFFVFGTHWEVWRPQMANQVHSTLREDWGLRSDRITRPVTWCIQGVRDITGSMS